MAARSKVLDIYDVHLHLATSRRDWATLRRRYPKLKAAHPDEFGSTNRFTQANAHGPRMAHVAVFLDIPAHHGDHAALLDTCAHEATHAALGILDTKGVDYDKDSEPLACLLAWLTCWLYEGCA